MGSSGVAGWHDEHRAKAPGVTVARSGALGVVNYAATDYWPLNTVLYVTDFHGNDARFAYYFLQQFDFGAHNSGSVQPSLNRNFIHPIPVDVPPLVEQRAIVGILGALDDKIELNKRMNETLEATVQTLFDSWFIHHGSLSAKAGRMKYVLADLAQHHTSTVAPSATPRCLFQHFSIPAFDAGQAPVLEQGSAIKSNKTVVPPDSVLLSKLNPDIPRVWMPTEGSGTAQVCSTEFLPFTPLDPANRVLIYSLFRSRRFRTMLQSLVTGTSRSHQRVPPQALKRQPVLSGTPELFRRFGELAAPWLRRTMVNRAESMHLAAIRDSLLPRLVSGTIRVPDAERIVEAAA